MTGAITGAITGAMTGATSGAAGSATPGPTVGEQEGGEDDLGFGEVLDLGEMLVGEAGELKQFDALLFGERRCLVNAAAKS